jgi:hypothetical protein
VTQGFKVSSEDAQHEHGKFVYEIYGLPVAPYILTGISGHTPTMDSPYDSDESIMALMIKPIAMRFVGSVTHKVYDTYKFPQ